jgi:hypothetical protein
MQPQTATAPPEPAEGPNGPAPGYIWIVYPVLSRLPFVEWGPALTADDAREEAEEVMTARPEESGFAVILAHDSDDKIGRRVGHGVYRWMPYRFPGLQP